MQHQRQYEMLHITGQVEAAVRKSGVIGELYLVSPMHVTAAAYVIERERTDQRHQLIARAAAAGLQAPSDQ